MDTVAQRIDKMNVTVTSPDGNIRATLVNRNRIGLEFRSGAYEAYAKPSIEHQLERLALLLWSGYRKGYNAILNDGRSDRPERRTVVPRDEAQRRFYQAVSEIHVRAKSPSQVVRMQTIGMQRWKVRLSDDALTLPELRFGQEVLQAGGDVLNRFRGRIAQLKEEHFGYSFVKQRARR